MKKLEIKTNGNGDGDWFVAIVDGAIVSQGHNISIANLIEIVEAVSDTYVSVDLQLTNEEMEQLC